jgi:hypothetical protein
VNAELELVTHIPLGKRVDEHLGEMFGAEGQPQPELAKLFVRELRDRGFSIVSDVNPLSDAVGERVYTVHRQESQHLDVRADNARDAYQRALEVDVGWWMTQVEQYDVYDQDGTLVDEEEWG